MYFSIMYLFVAPKWAANASFKCTVTVLMRMMSDGSLIRTSSCTTESRVPIRQLHLRELPASGVCVDVVNR